MPGHEVAENVGEPISGNIWRFFEEQ